MQPPSYLVVDNFLDTDTCGSIARYFDVASFRFVKSGNWNRVFGLLDGDPLVGDEVFCPDAPPDYCRVPTGTVIDTFVNALTASLPLVRTLLRGGDWDTFSVRPYMYPAGSGLGWHTDGDYAGAFIYYAHERWDPTWGGEFMIADDIGQCGRYILPEPNRLVFLNGGIRHSIKKVEPAAGTACRQSLTGFFYDKSRLLIA